MALRTMPIHRTGNRPNLFMGGDRELVMLSGLLSVALIFAAQELKAAIFGIVLWFGALYLLRLMAKSDPQMRFVWMRGLRYKRYYPPRSTPFHINTKRQGNQYK